MSTRLTLGLLCLLGCAPPLEREEVLGVRIEPAEPLATDPLRVVVDDLVGGTPSLASLDAEVSWSVDGGLVRDLTGGTVPIERTSKGQHWSAEVYVPSMRTAFAASVEVQNTTPSALVVVTEQGAFRPLTAEVLAEDGDGDALTWEGRWWLDGIEFDEVEGPEVEPGYLLRDQRWTYKVEVTDGEERVFVEGDAIVGNTPPSIYSLVMRPDPPEDGRYLSASVVAVDADSDPLTTTAMWILDDVPMTGTVQRGPRVELGQRVELVVRVEDAFGGAAEASTGVLDVVP